MLFEALYQYSASTLVNAVKELNQLNSETEEFLFSAVI